jgi:hypothetical protein
MKRLYVIIFTVLFVSCSQLFAADIAFTIEKGYLIVPVKIKNDISVEMVVATGSDVSMIDFDAAKKYQLRLSYTGVGVITGSNDRTVTFSDVNGIIIGDEKPTSLYMKLLGLDSIKKKTGRDIFGILGSDFFKGKTIKIDFKNKVLSLVKQSDSKNAETNKNQNRLVFKIDYSKPNVFGSEIVLPVGNEILLNGKKIKSLFDTGNAFPISILSSGIKELGFETPEKETVKPSQVKSVKFFDYEMVDVPSVSVGKNSSLDRDTKDFGSIVGIGILQNFTVTFDYKNKLIILEK